MPKDPYGVEYARCADEDPELALFRRRQRRGYPGCWSWQLRCWVNHVAGLVVPPASRESFSLRFPEDGCWPDHGARTHFTA